MSIRHAVLIAVLWLGLPVEGLGQWPQWRGAERTGSVSGPPPAGNWPNNLTLLWERDVGSGYAGPLVVGDFVWVHSRQGNAEVISALRLSTGAPVWRKSHAVPFQQDSSARSHGQGPYSTPCWADDRLFTLSVTGILSVWSARSGELLWQRESAAEFTPSFPFFGEASSPLVWGGLCFVHLGGHPRDNFKNSGTGAMLALEVSSGREKWRWPGDDPAVGASPILAEIEGQPQLIFKTRQNIVGLDPRSGERLWQIPYKVYSDNTIVTPLLIGNLLLTSDYDEGMRAWRIRPDGRAWTANPEWKHHEVSLFMSSPVVSGGLLMGFSHLRKGQLFLLDPQTGKLLWQGEPRSGEQATLILWGSQVLVFLDDGWLAVGEVSPSGFRLLQKYQLGGSGGWAHPALAGNRILIREGSRLAAYRIDWR